MVNGMCSLVIIEMRRGFEDYEAEDTYIFSPSHTVYAEHL